MKQSVILSVTKLVKLVLSLPKERISIYFALLPVVVTGLLPVQMVAPVMILVIVAAANSMLPRIPSRTLATARFTRP